MASAHHLPSLPFLCPALILFDPRWIKEMREGGKEHTMRLSCQGERRKERNGMVTMIVPLQELPFPPSPQSGAQKVVPVLIAVLDSHELEQRAGEHKDVPDGMRSYHIKLAREDALRKLRDIQNHAAEIRSPHHAQTPSQWPYLKCKRQQERKETEKIESSE